MQKQLLALIVALCSSHSFAAEPATEESLVTGLRARLYETGMLKDVIQKTEVVSEVNITQKNASNLSEALNDAVGVRVNNECSMCGVKRVMLNGLRGEHTTILVDGIPTYTMMSGFYGLDAATMAGVERIEIARGAGASLIAPEAIGGTINIINKEARANAAEIDVSGGELGYQKATFFGSGVFNSDNTRLSASAQYDNRDQFDGDNNGVSESPTLENTSATLFLSHDFGQHDNVRIRVNSSASEIFGGPMHTSMQQVVDGFNTSDEPSEILFVDDDVRNRFIGQAWETTEWIESSRREFYATWVHEFNPALNMTLTGSDNQHAQDSFYEGFIYAADNAMRYFDARFNIFVSTEHLITTGVDTRIEDLRSNTNSTSPKYVSDSFDYNTTGVYIQDTWQASERVEVAAALRFDHVVADFIDPAKPGKEIDQSIISPRLDIRWMHDDALTSRFSVGRGYRAPLSFFESDHGILDGDVGFDIQITDLERSLSYNYALSYEANAFSLTGALAHTSIDNLATLSVNDDGVPVLQQMQETAYTQVADIALSYNFLSHLTTTATVEHIHYSDNFKQAFGVVPVEQRLVLSADWDINGWDIYASATWVGERDLSTYATPENPTFDKPGLQPKSQIAAAYWTVDTRIVKRITHFVELYIGATNLFNYSQANNMQTPLFYEDGGYDVAHIYGPLRGRQAYLGAKFEF